MRVQSWETLPHAKCGKNQLRGHTPFGQIVTKKVMILGAIFLKPKGLNLALGCGPVTPSLMQNFVKIA